MSASYPYPEEAMNLQTLPKVELHLHLDCCLSYEVVQRLAPDVTPEAFARDFVAPPKCKSLAEYLRTPPNHVALMQSEEALRLVVDDLFAQLARDGVIYAEIRFAPLFHTRRGLSRSRSWRSSTTRWRGRARPAASRRGSSWRRCGISARRRAWRRCGWSSVSAARTWWRSTSRATRRAIRSMRTCPRSASPSTRHPRTAHAGEAAGPASVWETLRLLQPSRIGHGVRSIEDEALMAHLVATGVHLEVCPTSNIQTDVVPAYGDHPVDRLYRLGLSLGINTDTRTVTDVTLTQEYERLHETFGWGAEEFLAVNLNAIPAAFVEPSVKQALEQRLLEQHDRFGNRRFVLK